MIMLSQSFWRQKGYPGAYDKCTEIKGVNTLPSDSKNMVFHAGTKTDGDKLLAIGGRVLNVTARGSSFEEAPRARLCNGGSNRLGTRFSP